MRPPRAGDAGILPPALATLVFFLVVYFSDAATLWCNKDFLIVVFPGSGSYVQYCMPYVPESVDAEIKVDVAQ